MFNLLIRAYSYLYHAALGLFLFAIGAVALATPDSSLQIPILPWDEPALSYWLFFGSLAGLVSVALAVLGKLRLLFPIWAIVVFVLMARGFIFTQYAFSGAGSFRWAMLLTFGALVAIYGAYVSWRKPRSKA
jgi:hypothetical protein